MRHTNWKTISIGLVCPAALGWLIVSSLLGRFSSVSTPSNRFGTGVDGAMAQARELLNVYRDTGWNRRAIPEEYMLIADEAATPNPDPRVRVRRSFGMGVYPTNDELAFHCDFYVKHRLRVAVGREGSIEYTGFYIVAFRNGNIIQVPADEVRYKFGVPGRGTAGLPVFPGMRDYAAATTVYQMANQ